MGKRGTSKKSLKIVMIVLVIVIVAIAAYFLGFFSSLGGGGGNTIVLNNPVAGLNDEEAVAQFDESFVVFLLYSIGASELHNVPFTSNEPVIEFHIDEDVYTGVVRDGIVSVGRGVSDDEDIIIRTSKIEGVKMLRDGNYITESFVNGGSSIELVAGKVTLFAKGYLGLYTGLTGDEADIE